MLRWSERVFKILIRDKSAVAVEYTYCFSVEGKDPNSNVCPGYAIKQFEAPVMLDLWRMQSTPPLPSLSGPHWSGMLAPDRVLFIGQIELFDI